MKKIGANDRHVGGGRTFPRLLLFTRDLSFIAAWFREDWIVSRLALTSICRKPSTVPTAGRPSLSRYTMIPCISAHDRIHANARKCSYLPVKLLSRRRTRAPLAVLLPREMGKYLPPYILLTTISRMRKICCSLVDPNLTRFLSFSLSLETKEDVLSAN